MKSVLHPLRSAAIRGKSTFLEYSRKLVLRGGHLELRAIAALYGVQINILSPGGACNTVNEKSDKDFLLAPWETL